MNNDAIRDKVAIVGMGCCKFGENWDKSPEDMIVEAAFEAYQDAGIDNPQEQIEAVFCGAVYPSKGTAEVADALHARWTDARDHQSAGTGVRVGRRAGDHR